MTFRNKWVLAAGAAAVFGFLALGAVALLRRDELAGSELGAAGPVFGPTVLTIVGLFLVGLIARWLSPPPKPGGGNRPPRLFRSIRRSQD